MGADEEGTLERLKAHRRGLIDPKIAEHHGRIVKTTGDGLLVEFASVVDAVRCAAEIQRGMLDREAETPEDRRIAFRVGVNLGDVIVDKHDIYGDGVNIAARLEALSEPGSICVSRVVHDQVHDKLSYDFADLGEQRVKNIARPVPVYSLVNSEGETGPEEITDAFLALMQPPFTPADLAASATVVARGSFDPRIFTQGTIAFLFTFDSGYRLMWLDSAGPITPTLQAAMETIQSTNLAIVGYQAQDFPRFQVPVTMQLVELFNPDLVFPAHHDEYVFSIGGKSIFTVVPDMATEPLFLAIRETLPKTRTLSTLYRTPVLVDIQTGEFRVGGECDF
jgi:Adenylate and Guanylate cyclase catalytic domain